MTGYEKQASQLKAWARSIARLHSLELLNFTTSFVDGEVFPKIVDEYIPIYLAFGHRLILQPTAWARGSEYSAVLPPSVSSDKFSSKLVLLTDACSVYLWALQKTSRIGPILHDYSLGLDLLMPACAHYQDSRSASIIQRLPNASGAKLSLTSVACFENLRTAAR